jgi:hypothetical protein
MFTLRYATEWKNCRQRGAQWPKLKYGRCHRHHPPPPLSSSPHRTPAVAGSPAPASPTTPVAPSQSTPTTQPSVRPPRAVETSLHLLLCPPPLAARRRASSKAASSVPIRRVTTPPRGASGLGGRGFGVTRPDHKQGPRISHRNSTRVYLRVTQKRKKKARVSTRLGRLPFPATDRAALGAPRSLLLPAAISSLGMLHAKRGYCSLCKQELICRGNLR